MSLYSNKIVDFSFEDHRGSLNQLVHDGYKQINVLETKAGVLRGGHYHKSCNESFFIISGSVETTLRMVGTDEKENVTFSKGDFFEIHPNTVHSMYFTEDCLMVQMYDIPVEFSDGTKDILAESI